RWRLWRGDPLPKARLRGHRLLARALARRLGAADTRLVVPQSLLPHLWASGELQGRRFEVWMTALPMAEIQRRLDLAHRQHPHSPTLGDFRADAALMRAEAQALAQAECWISPHAGILALAGTRALTLPWSMPSADATRASVAAHELPRVLLASSPLARKGALELREALRGLPLQLVLPPGAQEAPELWDGIAVVRAPSMADGIAGADVVVLPAWIEHQPRGLLLALALGKPVVASDACGLARDGTWHCVEAGDAQGLRAAILQALVAAAA